MAKQKQSTVKIQASVGDALDDLKGRLRRIYGARASREDIVGAMAHGVTAHQLHGMLTEYLKHEKADEGEAGDASESK